MARSRFPVARLGALVGSQGLSAGLGLVNISLAAHVLPTVAFGMLVTGLGLAQGLRLASTMQSWQALIRHGDGGALRLASSLAWIEHALGATAGVVLLIVLHLGGGALGLDRAGVEALSWLALGMACNAADPWLGVLHARGRQGVTAAVQAGGAVLRCGGVILAVGCGSGIGGLVAAHVCADIAVTIGAFLAAAYVLGAGPRRLLRAWLQPLSPKRLLKRFPGLGRLLVAGSMTAVLGALASQFDVPLVALILGPEEAGRYRLVRALAALALVVAIPVRQMCQAHWSGSAAADLRPLLLRTWLIALPAGALGLAVLAPWLDRLLPLLFGSHALGLGGAATVMLGAAGIAVLTAPAQAALVIIRRETWNALGQATLVVVHLGLLPILAAAGGLGLAVWSLAFAGVAMFLVVALAAWRTDGGRDGR